MKQSLSREANSCLPLQEIPFTVDNVTVCYHLQNQPQSVLVLNQIIQVKTRPLSSSEINFNIVVPSTTRSTKCSPRFRLPYQYVPCILVLLHASCLHCLSGESGERQAVVNAEMNLWFL